MIFETRMVVLGVDLHNNGSITWKRKAVWWLSTELLTTNAWNDDIMKGEEEDKKK